MDPARPQCLGVGHQISGHSRTSAGASAALANGAVSVGDQRNGDRLGLIENDELPVIHHSPVCSRLTQNGVEPVRGQVKQIKTGKDQECKKKVTKGQHKKMIYVTDVSHFIDVHKSSYS